MNKHGKIMSMLVFWVVMSCGLVGRYQRFGGTESITTQKTNIFTTTRTSNLIYGKMTFTRSIKAIKYKSNKLTGKYYIKYLHN
jgi:hypothetical protein